MNPRDDLPGDDVPQDATLSRLYRELPDEAPAPETDAAILAAARRAVGAGPRRHGFVAAHWRGVGSAAAALLLGVALTVQWRTQEAGRLDETLATAPAPAAAPATAPDDRLEVPEGKAPAEYGAAPAPRPLAKPAAPARDTGPATAGGKSEAGKALTMRGLPAPAARAEAGSDAAGGGTAGASPDAGTASASASLADAPAAPPPVALAAEASARPGPQAQQKADAQALDAALAERKEARAGSSPAAAGSLAAPPVAPTAPPAPAGALADRLEAPRARIAVPAAKALAGATAEAAGLPLHARLMAAGRYHEALAALAAPATPDAVVDRDLLEQWLAPGRAPACATTPGLGPLALLCDGLRARAAGQPAAPGWRERLDASGLASGGHAYRRDLVDKLFGPRSP